MACGALVTGASSGVGLAASRALASRGCDLVMAARGGARLQEAAEEVSRRYGVRALPVVADLTREADVRSLVASALSALGRVDVAFLSYGNPSCEPCEPLEAPWSEWVRAFEMYVASSVAVMRELAERNPVKATVIMVSSFSSRAPMWPTGVSDVVRASLPALARLVARRYPAKLRPIVLELGSFRTPGAERLISALARAEGADPERYWEERVAGLSPLGRLGREDELEAIIAWLAFSPEYLAGVAVSFDGASTPCVV